MLLYFFQICSIFILYLIIQVNCSLVQENRTTEDKYLLDHVPGEKCEFSFCSCADFRKLDQVGCLSRKELPFSSLPDYDGNDIYILSFYDSKSNYNLTKKMFHGLNIRILYLNDPEIIVAENVLEGVIGLYKLEVHQSGIEVIFLIILIFIISFPCDVLHECNFVPKFYA